MRSAPNTTRCAGRCDRFVQGGDPSEPNAKVLAQEIVFERTIYGDSADTGLTDAQQQQANLRGKSSSTSTAPASSPPISTTSKAIRCAAAASSLATTRTRPTGRKIPASKPRHSPAAPSMTRSTAPSRSPRPTTASIARPSTKPTCWRKSTSICAAQQHAQPVDALRHQYRLQRQGPAHAHRICQRRADRRMPTTRKRSGSLI